jgi:streptogramin lyase
MFATRRTTTLLGQARRQQRSAAFLLQALLALGSLLVLASGCDTGTSNSAVTPPVAQAQFIQQEQVHLAPAPTISTTVRTAQSHLYTFSTSNVGLMQPAVDAQGNVWAGEMNVNRLGRLNSQTGVVTSWTPPGGQYGIMTTTVDAQGDAWFAEQNANYIGRFDPRQQTFRIFPLGTWKGSPLGPQDLHFDGRGLLWFTAEAGGAIGALDPQTGQITFYRLPNPQAQVFGLSTDTAGRLWFTEVLPGKLGMLDPATGTLTELPVPALWGKPPALYQLLFDHQGHIWFVDVGADALVRYAPEKHTLTFFQLSLPGSAPFGLTLDPAGTLWFTVGGSPANYVGKMAP